MVAIEDRVRVNPELDRLVEEDLVWNDVMDIRRVLS
jgi:hypothetical protein